MGAGCVYIRVVFQRKREKERRSSGLHLSYEEMAGWPRRRQRGSADIIEIGSERFVHANPQHLIRGTTTCMGQHSLFGPLEDEDWLHGARAVTARVLRALPLPLRYTNGAIQFRV